MSSPTRRPMGSGRLKPGWARVAFGDVVRLCTDRSSDPAADGFERYVGLEHLDPGDLTIRRWGEVGDGTTFTSVFRPGQVLFGKRRVYQRKVGAPNFSGVCSGDIYVLESKNEHYLLPDLLPFICQTDAFFGHADGTSAGSLSPRTNWQSLAAYEFLLPPLKDQQQTATLLWALYAVRRGFLRIQRTHISVVKSSLYCALSGVSLRGEFPERPATEPGNTRSPWAIRPVREICQHDVQGVQVGPFGGSVSSKYFAENGVPLLKIGNISEDGTLNLAELVQLDVRQARSLASRYSVQANDVVTAAQATIGRTAVVDNRVAGAIISQHLIRIRPDQELCLSHWLHASFCSPFVLRQLYTAVRGGTRAGLNTNEVEGILIPVPPLEVQRDFVNRLSVLHKLHSVGIEYSRTVENLTNAMLQWLNGSEYSTFTRELLPGIQDCRSSFRTLP